MSKSGSLRPKNGYQINFLMRTSTNCRSRNCKLPPLAEGATHGINHWVAVVSIITVGRFTTVGGTVEIISVGVGRFSTVGGTVEIVSVCGVGRLTTVGRTVEIVSGRRIGIKRWSRERRRSWYRLWCRCWGRCWWRSCSSARLRSVISET